MTSSPTIVVIDNYDSFVYNLVQYLGEAGANVVVKRNDAVSVDEVASMNPQGILISPGPGRPEEAGVSNKLLLSLSQSIPTLGVCLGHQCLGALYGAKVVRAEHVMHGKTSPIFHNGTGVLKGLPSPFLATRYHSLIVEKTSVGAELAITAESDDGLIMGLAHKTYPIQGLQFHPESILTQGGHLITDNFLAGL